jgi:hypothetical protein
MVDATDLKSVDLKRSCGFKSLHSHYLKGHNKLCPFTFGNFIYDLRKTTNFCHYPHDDTKYASLSPKYIKFFYNNY